MLRVASIFAFAALLMFGMANGAPKKALDLDGDNDTRTPFDDDENANEGGDDGFNNDDDDDDAKAEVVQSDQPQGVNIDPKTDPTDLNNNGVTGGGESGSSGTTVPSDKQCKNTATPESGCNKVSGSCAKVNSGCAKPRSPKNGGIRARGSYVEYFCLRGYQLHGPKRIRCIRANGKHLWHRPAPVCKRRSRYVTFIHCAILARFISRNGPYIGGHLAFYFKLNFKQVYNVL